MAISQTTPCRFALACAAACAAFAAVVGPAAVEMGGRAVNPAAQPAQCTSGESKDSFSLACFPQTPPSTGGAPSEEQLTQDNPGFASPSRR
jgi:hypothetical protein